MCNCVPKVLVTHCHFIISSFKLNILSLKNGSKELGDGIGLYPFPDGSFWVKNYRSDLGKSLG